MTESTLAAALADLQTRLPDIAKTETAEVETKTGRKYSYTYANLTDISRAVLPLLGELGLSFIAKPTMRDGRFVLAYSLLHTSGQREDGEYPLPANGSPQELGSAITYGRRYCLCAVTGVAPDEDDDAVMTRPAVANATGRGRRRQASGPEAVANATTAEDKPRQSPALKRLHTLFSQANIGGRDDRLAFVAEVVGRAVESSSDLTPVEIAHVAAALEAGIAEQKPVTP